MYGNYDQTTFKNVLHLITKECFKFPVEEIKHYDFFKYRLAYLTVHSKNLLIIFVTDITDKLADVKREMLRCKNDFLSLYSDILDENLNSDALEMFNPVVEAIHKNMRPKISLVGFSGVGKTTITNLICEREIPRKHIPTITGDIATIKIGKLHFSLWDFAGQDQFSFLWENFIMGSDAVLLITNSSESNVLKSKYFVDLVERKSPNSHIAAIGNKQDIPLVLSPQEITDILSVKAYPMIAIDVKNREKMVNIISEILDISSDTSPQLKPLLDREKQLQYAEEALIQGNFNEAVKILEEIADLCIGLGEDALFQEFQRNADKIRMILANIETAHSIEQGQTILLIDDEEAVRRVLQIILEKSGYRVFLAKNGRNAVDLYSNTLDSIDLIVTDLLMPEMGGVEAISELRKLRPDIKVVYISGYPGEKEKLLDEVENFLSKPIKKEDLLGKIRELLETSSH